MVLVSRWAGPSHRGWRIWLITFGILFTLGSIWSLATPLFSVPDEAFHTIRAVAVARGQLSGREVVEDGHVGTAVTVPKIFETAPELPQCYRSKPAITADCAPAFVGATADTEMLTSVGRYPPLYYMGVGLPSLVESSAVGVRLMRLVSLGINCALLASAFACARESSRLRPLVLGLSVAVTPMVLYLAGSINPNGLEISSAIALWASLSALLIVRDSGVTPSLSRRAGIAGALLAASRPSSLLMLALILGITAVAFLRTERLRTLVRDRAAVLWGTVMALSALVSFAWVVTKSALGGFFGTPVPPEMSAQTIIRTSFGRTFVFIREMVGVFGSLETHSPLATHMAWLFVLGLLGLLAIGVGTPRARWALVGLAALVVVLPVVLESLQARVIGFGWQGRYTLPVAVGIPILASVISGRATQGFGRALWRAIFALIAVGQILAFAWALRRFAVGNNGLLSPINWQPPFTAQFLFGAFVAASVVYAVWLQQLSDESPEAIDPSEAAEELLVSAGKQASTANFGADGQGEEGSVRQTKRIIGFVMMVLSLSAAGLVAGAGPAAAAPGRADLCGVKILAPTGSNKTELHCLSAASTFQNFSVQTGTGLHLLDGQDDRWRMVMGDIDADGRADLCGVKILGPTGSNKTEIHCLSAASNFKTFKVQVGTGLHLLDGQEDRWRIVMGDVDGDKKADLCGVKVVGPTGTNKTELHCLSAASNFQKFVVQVGTGLHLLDGEADRWRILMGDVDADGKADLCGAKVVGPTGTNKTELHCLGASSTFKTFKVQVGTGLHLLDGQTDRWEILMGDIDGDAKADLCGAKVVGPTGTNKTEIHCLSASSNFKTFKVQVGTGLHLLDGQQDRWRLVMGDADGT